MTIIINFIIIIEAGVVGGEIVGWMMWDVNCFIILRRIAWGGNCRKNLPFYQLEIDSLL